MSRVSGSKNQERSQLFGSDLVLLNQDHMMHNLIMGMFVSDLGALASSIRVVAIHKNACSNVAQTKFQSFLLVSKAMEKKCNGDANIKYAWYGASKEEIIDIISNGFVQSSYHHGVHFSATNHPLDCLKTASQDKDGLRHLLICRVLLGKLEVVSPGSGQFQPSSEDLDSGVDNLLSPRKYIIWSSRLNTHIYPEFILSFRVSPHPEGVDEYPTLSKDPNVSRISFDDVLTRLSSILPSHAINLITKYHNGYREGKITLQEYEKQVNKVTGNRMVFAIIHSTWAQRKLAQPRLTDK